MKQIKVVAGILRRGNQVYATQRGYGPQKDGWEFPGGKLEPGESPREALRRELREETGYDLEIDRLGFIHEDFFRGDLGKMKDKLIYEIGFYYYVKTPEDFAPRCDVSVEEGSDEHLTWIDPHGDTTLYPTFFRTELDKPCSGVRHFVTDER